VDGHHELSPWREPVRGGYPHPSTARLPGVDQLRALIGSDATPPIGRLVGMTLTDVGLAGASFSMPATRWLLSPQGVISCGTLAILADGPLGCAVHSALPAATAYSTSELSLRLLRPARAGGTLLPAPSAAPRGKPAPVDGLDPYERPAAGQILEQEIWERLSGLEILERQIAGELPWPPIHHLTGLRPIAVDLKVNFLRPVLPDGRELQAHGRVRHSGRTISVAEADVINADGKAVAVATGSAMVLPGRAAALDDPRFVD
jgi:acyl-coenzyme A thioesterase PaaI-like protein